MTGPLLLVLVPLAAVAAATVWARRSLLAADVLGTSMHPTYRPGDKVLVRRVPGDRVRPGDIVVADIAVVPDNGPALPSGKIARQPGETVWEEHREPRLRLADMGGRSAWPPGAEDTVSRVVKRVAAVPGDPVPDSVPRRAGETLVPAGCLVLLGDNPDESLDSRHFGYVPANSMVGKVIRTLSGGSGADPPPSRIRS
ncbi:S26 family signal peptidase [Microbispora sp. NPDC088329]|uniref:S26 family signal peptidase n=1 Tax=Microbispora sp. NPDC088329 TaxID=3154869 RepID=UPI00341D8613